MPIFMGRPREGMGEKKRGTIASFDPSAQRHPGAIPGRRKPGFLQASSRTFGLLDEERRFNPRIAEKKRRS
jgi:hypothetical protein